ncbi:co-chaperone YbbN [uncultured Amnibacterium sp.]|uniref:co-chaperone YbbN n=1 Tax=uncultured Amnibacterium sp. TaxID=1631851 RepID=UPI0035CA937C
MAAVPGPSVGALRGAVDLSALVARSAPARPVAPGQPAGTPPAAGRSSITGEAAAGAEPAVPLVLQVGDADFASVVELSSTVPVVVALVAGWSTPSTDLVASLTRVVESLGGRVVLAVVDTDANPQLTAAFQAQSIPTVVAVIAGRPVSLFTGTAPEEQLRPLLDQVLALAEQNGVTGSVGAGAGAAGPGVPAGEDALLPEQPLPPLHAEAYDAVDRGDYPAAARLFRTAIAQDPRDLAAVAALAQVELLDRLQGADPDALRAAAAQNPKDADAALAVADLDMSGGHVDDAFDRVLSVFPALAPDDRTTARKRLLDYFELVGTDDPRVAPARRRLASLLY